MRVPRYIKVATTVALVGLLAWFGYRLANMRGANSYRIDFDTLPASDEALSAWLASQPGATDPSVRRDGRVLVVEYVCRIRGDQPDPVGAAKELGYAGLHGYSATMKTRW